ncbi:MAG: hypothetical protein JXQ76_07200 [Campylobacterales bacterium]|nr:hypothetical protein [Campylobacterales bacterium]
MKSIVETLGQRNIIFKSLHKVTPQELGSKKQIEIYIGTQLDNYYALVLSIKRKSRVLTKDVQDYIAFHQKAQTYNDSKINKKYIIIDAPLCSKAKAALIEDGWQVCEIGEKGSN